MDQLSSSSSDDDDNCLGVASELKPMLSGCVNAFEKDNLPANLLLMLNMGHGCHTALRMALSGGRVWVHDESHSVWRIPAAAVQQKLRNAYPAGQKFVRADREHAHYYKIDLQDLRPLVKMTVAGYSLKYNVSPAIACGLCMNWRELGCLPHVFWWTADAHFSVGQTVHAQRFNGKTKQSFESCAITRVHDNHHAYDVQFRDGVEVHNMPPFKIKGGGGAAAAQYSALQRNMGIQVTDDGRILAQPTTKMCPDALDILKNAHLMQAPNANYVLCKDGLRHKILCWGLAHCSVKAAPKKQPWRNKQTVNETDYCVLVGKENCDGQIHFEQGMHCNFLPVRRLPPCTRKRCTAELGTILDAASSSSDSDSDSDDEPRRTTGVALKRSRVQSMHNVSV